MSIVTSHACACMCYVRVFGRFWFLVQEYKHPKSKGAPQIKFPAGTGEAGETCVQTMGREFAEEVLYDHDLATAARVLKNAEFTHSKHLPDQRSPGGTHEMRFFLINAAVSPGTMRGEGIQEDDGTSLGAPYLLPLADLIGTQSKLYRTHWSGLAAAVLYLFEAGKADYLSMEQLAWCRENATTT